MSNRVTPAAEAADNPTIYLLKTAELLKGGKDGLLRSKGVSMNSNHILTEYWEKEKSIDQIFPPECFEAVPWEKLQNYKYAVLTYQWGGATWDQLLNALRKTFPIQTASWIWVAVRPRTTRAVLG